MSGVWTFTFFLNDEFASFLYENFMEEWKREIIYEERKNNASGFVKVVELDAFYYLLF